MRRTIWFVVSMSAAIVACGSSGGGGSGDKLATLDDFCAKCGTCVVTPGFSEGFCTPWIAQGGSFDRLGCSSKGDTTQLDNQNVSAGTLTGWTCQQFDDNE